MKTIKKKRFLKKFNKLRNENNYIMMKTLPYVNKERNKKNVDAILNIKEFSFFSKKINIRKQYEALIKSIKRNLLKNAIISKKEEKIGGGKKRARYEYVIGNMTYIF